MRTIDNATDIMETTENVKRAMKMLEMINDKLDLIESVHESKPERLEYELMKELPNMQVLAGSSRDLLADEYQSLNATYEKWLNTEMNEIANNQLAE